MSNKQQTAVDWFAEQISSKNLLGIYTYDEMVMFDDLLKQANKMFEEQMIDFANAYSAQDQYKISAKDYYKENLLNYDCQLKDIADQIVWESNEVKFIRPSKDSKVFNGKLYSKIKWEDTVQMVKEKYLGVMPPVTIQVTSPKKIYKEARVWIVDGKVVTSSYYKFGDNVAWTEDVEPEGLEFAQNMANLYKVAKAFVMDICLTPDGWKIVEINCVNCSGFYRGDLQKLVMALEDLYNDVDKMLFD